MLVGVFYGRAYGGEQLDALHNRQKTLVAVAIDRLALNVIHDEIRQSLGRRATVEQMGDIGMMLARPMRRFPDRRLGNYTHPDDPQRHIVRAALENSEKRLRSGAPRPSTLDPY
jgi:hypothetical protein